MAVRLRIYYSNLYHVTQKTITDANIKNVGLVLFQLRYVERSSMCLFGYRRRNREVIKRDRGMGVPDGAIVAVWHCRVDVGDAP